MTVNPSIGEGLGVCTPADLERETIAAGPGEGCPNSSKIGTVGVQTPLLAEEVEGSVFLAQPKTTPRPPPRGREPLRLPDRPLHRAQEPEPGRPGQAAGQGRARPRQRAAGRPPSTTLPQIPFTRFSFHFREGQRAPLITPPACGTYTTSAELTPWARPSETRAPGAPPSRSPAASAAAPARPAARRPSSPASKPAPLNNNAGAFSPFLMRLTRADGDQDLTKLLGDPAPGSARQARRRRQMPRGRDRPGQAQRAAGAELGSPLLPGRLGDRPHPGRRRRRHARSPTCPAPSTSPAPTTAPRSRVVAITPARGRPLRRRHGRRPGRARPRPRDRRSPGRRLRAPIRSPTSSRGSRSRSGTCASTSTARTSPSTRPRCEPSEHPGDDLRRLRGRLQPRRRRPAGPPGPLPGGQLRPPGLQAQPLAAPQGRHQPRRPPRPQGGVARPGGRCQHRGRRRPPAALGLPRPGPHPHDLHPRPVRRRGLPHRGRLRPRQGLHPAARRAPGRPDLPALLQQQAARPGRRPARHRRHRGLGPHRLDPRRHPHHLRRRPRRADLQGRSSTCRAARRA